MTEPCATPQAPAYRLESVRHSYATGAESLAGIDLEIACGSCVAIVGANGSGKSTLLKMLDGLVFPTSGRIEAFGMELSEEALEDPEYRRRFRGAVGFVFQDPDVQLFSSNGYEELAFGPLQLGVPDAEVRARVDRAAEALRIEPLLDRAPYTLSGGEKKRVSIASVLTMEPRMLLLDEPSNALDPRSQVWLLEVLDDWKAAGNTAVIATHDLTVAAEIADRMVVLSEEHVIVADGAPDDVLAQQSLLLAVNLIHEHAHLHALGQHVHPHAHGHLHE